MFCDCLAGALLLEVSVNFTVILLVARMGGKSRTMDEEEGAASPETDDEIGAGVALVSTEDVSSNISGAEILVLVVVEEEGCGAGVAAGTEESVLCSHASKSA